MAQFYYNPKTNLTTMTQEEGSFLVNGAPGFNPSPYMDVYFNPSNRTIMNTKRGTNGVNGILVNKNGGNNSTSANGAPSTPQTGGVGGFSGGSGSGGTGRNNGSGSGVDVYGNPVAGGYSSDPQSNMATISQEQFNIARKYMTPEIRALTDYIDPTKYKGQIDKASNLFQGGYDTGIGSAQRKAQSYGITLDPTEIANVKRNNNLTRGLGLAKARNDARTQIVNRRNTALTGMMGLGKGFSSLSNRGLNSAGRIQSRRLAQNRQSDAQDTSTMVSLAGIGLGLAMGA